MPREIATPNIFQRLILQWERLHPYNAAQAVRLASSPSRDHLSVAWQGAMGDLAPVRMTLAGGGSGDSRQWALIEVSDCPLEAFLTEQINTRFGEDERPFRPFVAHEPTGAVIGIVYRHCVCDSVSVRAILHRWLACLSGDATPAETLRPAAGGYWRYFGPWASSWPLIPTLLHQLNLSVRMRKCRRMCRCGSADTQFTEHRAEPGLIEAVCASARSRRVKVNDLFLAALARAAHDLSPLEDSPRRRDLALGTIVDLRALKGRAPRDCFGLFLGFNTTILRPKWLADTDRLVASVAAQSELSRNRRMAQSSQARMAVALAVGKLYGDRKLAEFYRKRVPLAAGISNVTLDNTWVASAHPQQVGEYVRVSPTGPHAPLIVTPTTLGGRMHVGVSTRRGLIDDARARTIGRRFVAELQRLV